MAGLRAKINGAVGRTSYGEVELNPTPVALVLTALAGEPGRSLSLSKSTSAGRFLVIPDLEALNLAESTREDLCPMCPRVGFVVSCIIVAFVASLGKGVEEPCKSLGRLQN